jgi:hypothetical protein
VIMTADYGPLLGPSSLRADSSLIPNLDLDVDVDLDIDSSHAFGVVQIKLVPVRRRYASRYFSEVALAIASGRAGAGGCLLKRICSR